MLKSAPCNCCQSSTDSTCTACQSHIPPLKMMDSTQGHWLNMTGGPTTWTATDTNASVTGAANCSNQAVLSTITITMVYSMSCSSGTPDHFSFDMEYHHCCSSPFAPNGGAVCSDAINAQVLNFPLNCTNPNFSFTFTSHPGTPYSSGATITVVPQ